MLASTVGTQLRVFQSACTVYSIVQLTTLAREWRQCSYSHRYEKEQKKNDDVVSAPPTAGGGGGGDEPRAEGVWRHTPTDKAAHRWCVSHLVVTAAPQHYSCEGKVRVRVERSVFWEVSRIFTKACCAQADGKRWKCLRSKMTAGRQKWKLEYRSL